ncbi:MAG TPA: hypothetical protein VK509_16120 [Polyangiales bacterium]|nr:hypothetical protein [Polyangiales bacterium]
MNAISQFSEDSAKVLKLFSGPVRHTQIGAYEAGKITGLGVSRAKQVLDGLTQVGELACSRNAYRPRCKRADRATQVRRQRIAARKDRRREATLEALRAGHRLDLDSLGELLGVKSATARDVLWALARERLIVMRRVGRAKLYVLATEPQWPKVKRKRIRPPKPPSANSLRRQHILTLLEPGPLSAASLAHLFSAEPRRGANAAANTLRTMQNRGLLTSEYAPPSRKPGAPRLLYRRVEVGGAR